MDKNERDTHFQGFADLLASEIDEVLHLLDNPYFVSSGMRNEVVTLIAQRAYDLVYFLLDKAPLHSGSFDVGWGTPDEIRETIKMLPDLTEWPKPQ